MSSRRDRSRSPPGRYNHGPPARGRRKYQIIIKNLPFDVDWKRLKNFVKDEAGDVKYANVIENNGRSAGFGIAEFQSDEDMQRAVQNLHRIKFSGREIHVFEDCDERELHKLKMQKGITGAATGGGNGPAGGGPRRDDRHPPPRGEIPTLDGVPVNSIPGVNLDDETIGCLGSGAIGNSIFVHNLLFEITESKLRDVFSLAGNIQKIDMQKSGHAVISYSKPIEAIKSVILFVGQELCGRKIMIKIDTQMPPKNDRGRPDNGRRSPPPPSYQPPRRDAPPPRNDHYDREQPRDYGGERRTRWDNTAQSQPPTNPPTRHNPPPTSNAPKDEWRYNQPTRHDSHRSPPNHGFEKPREHISRPGVIAERPAVSAVLIPKTNRYDPPPPPPPERHHSGGNGQNGSRNKITIENLPLSVTTQQIRNLFERAGDVDYVQLSDGGRCDLEYFDEYSTTDAIEKFNNFMLDGSRIQVYRSS